MASIMVIIMVIILVITMVIIMVIIMVIVMMIIMVIFIIIIFGTNSSNFCPHPLGQLGVHHEVVNVLLRPDHRVFIFANISLYLPIFLYICQYLFIFANIFLIFADIFSCLFWPSSFQCDGDRGQFATVMIISKLVMVTTEMEFVHPVSAGGSVKYLPAV